MPWKGSGAEPVPQAGRKERHETPCTATLTPPVESHHQVPSESLRVVQGEGQFINAYL